MSNEAAERTEEATPKRKQKERSKGNISRSKDLESALALCVGIALIAVFFGYVLDKLKFILTYTFTHLNPNSIETNDVVALLYPYAHILALIIVPFFVTLCIVIIISIRMEIGHVFSLEKIKFSLDKLSPKRVLSNAQRLLNPFNPRSLVELVKSLLKVGVVGFVGYSVANRRKGELFDILGMDLDSSIAVIGAILIEMLIKMCLAMLVMGFLDKKYQDYEYNKSIKMTKQEIKDEHKNAEGDPKIKSKIRSIQMQMARQRMMSAIPSADVVVTNPTHYAVAIKYDKETIPVPMVVAKGVDFVAFKIKEVAINNGVPIVENRPLARALYNSVPINGIIPSDLYVAVAEILGYVMRQRGQ